MRSKKLLICLVFLFVSLFAFGFNAKVNAIETSDAIKVEGAQVRTTGNAGIRFVATEAYEGENETYGILLAFGEATADDNFVVGGTVNGKAVANAEIATAEGTFAATLYDIPEAFYGQNISARAYVKAGETYVYSSTVCVKSLAEVVLKAKNDFAEGEIIDNVVTALANTKKAFSDAKNNFYVDSALYETNYAKLAVEFIKDWNKALGTNLDADTCFVMSGYDCAFKSAARGNTPTESGLYKFFSNETYGAKWTWFLDFLSETTSNSLAKEQIAAVKNADDTIASGDWYYGLNAISCILSTFHAAKVSAGSGNTDFTTKPYLLGELSTYNNTVYADLAGCELLEVEDSITLPAFTPNEGYAGSYTVESTSYELGQEYVVTEENKMFVATNTVISYTVEFYWEDELMRSDVYTVEAAFELGDFSFPGYAFEGWYDNAEFSGSPETTIAKGSTGNKVFYAKMAEGDTVEVTFEYMDASTVAELVAAFVADIKSYSTEDTREVNFLTTDAHSWGSDYMPFKSALDNSDGTFGAKWAQLFNLIAEANGNANYTAKIKALASETVDADAIYITVQELKGLRDSKQATKYYSAVMYDWGTDANGYAAKIIEAYKTETATVNLIVDADLPTPVSARAGYVFDGWYTSADYSGEAVTKVPAENTTLYAKWKAAE